MAKAPPTKIKKKKKKKTLYPLFYVMLNVKGVK